MIELSARGALRHAGLNGTRIAYRLRFSDRRTLAISVYPDLSVEAVAPRGRAAADIDLRMGRRIGWVRRQQRYFEALHPLPVPREFVPGETHRYLGRQYRLRVVEGPPGVRLSRPRMLVSLPGARTPPRVRRLIERWIRKRAREVFAARMERLVTRAGGRVPFPLRVRMQAMKTRWGSCTAAGTVTLHPELVRMPVSCIDYVIAHELCHLVRPDHSREFRRLLERLVPEWERARQRLNTVR